MVTTGGESTSGCRGGKRVINGIYTSAAGGRIQAARIDVIAQNLSKMSVGGFRGDFAAVQASAMGALKGAVGELITTPDFREGTVIPTGNSMDIALVGDGFFSVGKGQKVCYTRSGHMQIDADQNLAVVGGFKLLDTGGQPISVSPDLPILVSRAGEVMQGNVVKGQLGVVSFDNPSVSLVRDGVHFSTADPTVKAKPSTAKVEQEMREGSNVDSVRSMVELITSNRAFETNMRMVSFQDQGIGKLISGVGSIPL